VIERELPVNLVRGVLAWIVGLIAIPLTALPFVAYAHYSQEGRLIALHVDRAFRGPAFARLDPADAKYVKSHHLHYSNAVLVLNVHAVMDGGATSDAANPESSVLPVRLFAADMQMLRDAGYHTVTPEQITAWRAGVLDLPHDALLLTFDDGRTDTVLNAAPILRRVGMRATVFAIGGAWKKSPLYEASPEGLRSLQRQGWSIEAHASAPHGSIDAGGGTSLPYLSARRSVDGRLETLAQFRTRAAAEYRKARQAAEKIANRPVVAFAWPFGAYGSDTRTNDPRLAEINVNEARRVYSLGFNEDGQTSFGLLTRESDPMRIARFELVPTLSPRQLFERLELAIAATAPEVSRAG
jgi:poly-beta-1,6-N-acetyl-D-glucosamine N-deacetylase